VSTGPAAPGPRLVYDADATTDRIPLGPPEPPPRRRPWIALALLAALLLAGFQAWRAAELTSRVEVLTADLAAARAEIAARRQQLDAIRASVDDVRERVAGLAALAAEEPTAPSAQPPTAASAQ
jgi:hypothetical protein